MEQNNVGTGNEASASCLRATRGEVTTLWEGLVGWRALERCWEQIREMILDSKHFSFFMQVINRGHLNTAGGYAEGRVLDSLVFLESDKT